ncbi:unnamed protein product [Heligmosomoides polygyrus]|uniref:ShKT domain-containing protein n=1 Tax=Heligmosomoides polygyrus TaxID=6339 RepID=A0A3P8AHL1_HELPZ|nr:unnamed protein product [Heligmosomoides polygyrus]
MIMTSTVLPILCLMDWNSPKCRLNAPPPRFAPNYDVSKARAHELARHRAKSAIRAGGEDVLAPPLLNEPPDNDGFFTPVLPSAATPPRRALHSKGESTTVVTTTATTTTVTRAPTTTPSTTTTTSTSTSTSATMPATTTEPPRVVYLSDYDADYEASAESTVTKPLEHTTSPSVAVTVLPLVVTEDRAEDVDDACAAPEDLVVIRRIPNTEHLHLQKAALELMSIREARNGKEVSGNECCVNRAEAVARAAFCSRERCPSACGDHLVLVCVRIDAKLVTTSCEEPFVSLIRFFSPRLKAGLPRIQRPLI